jgi:hypothetical protein
MTKLVVGVKNQGFLYSNSAEKQVYRKLKLDLIKPYADKINGVISLAANNLLFEEMILSDIAFKNISTIESYEIMPKTYQKGLPKYRKLKKEHRNLYYLNESIFNADFAKHKVVVADIDLCGTFTIKLVNEIKASFQKIKNGIMFLTVYKDARNTNLIKYLEYFGVDNLKDYREKVFIKDIEDSCNVKLYCEPYEYKNKSANPKAKPMLLYTFVKGKDFKWKKDLTWK